MSKKYVAWDELHHYISLARLDKEYPEVDLVVSIGSGGMVPGVIISKILNVPVVNIGVKSYSVDNTQTYKAEWYQKFQFRVSKHKKILVVDDINDTGYTLAAVNNYLMSTYLKETDVEFLTIFSKQRSVFPCRSLQEISNDTWIEFPWEVK